MKKLLLGMVLVIVIVGLFLVKGQLEKKPSIKVLETTRAERGDIQGVLVATGVIKPQVGAEVKVGTRATGTVVKMNVKIGDRVEKGDLIAVIDDREIERGIDQQKAAIVAAQNTIAQVESTYPDRIKEARANYEYAKLSLERQERLAAGGYTSKDSFDKARSQFEAAEATLSRLQEEFKTQRKITRATLDEHIAQLKQQEVRLTYTRIYAPMNGVVSDVTLQEGETTVTGLQVANLITILDTNSLEMWSYVDETDIGRVKVGQRVEYYVDTYPTRIFRGTIEKIYPQPVVKENIVYYLAIVKVPREDAQLLKPEMTTHIKVIFDERENVVAVPNDAVKFVGGRQVAYRVTGPDTVQPVALRVGIRGEERTEILEGLAPGDVLATKLIMPGTSAPGAMPGQERPRSRGER